MNNTTTAKQNPKGEKIWLIVPASGIGLRFGEKKPKQYLTLNNGRSILAQTLKNLLSADIFSGYLVTLAKNDIWFAQAKINHKTPLLACSQGGDTRFLSVFNALTDLSKWANDNDWVLVHDAVRPLITSAQIQSFIGQIKNDPVGGLLATPVVDTIKKQTQNAVSTIDRKTLWHAQTPQMFRFHLLLKSLTKAKQEKWQITDESQAIERLGYQVKIIKGSANNIKITQQTDLSLANYYLTQNSYD